MKMLRLLLALAVLPVASFGTTILTWNFETGSAAFTSDYTPWTTPPPTEMTDGHYAVVQDPQQAHDLLSSFGDHTTGTGNMMVVNSATTAGTAVWRANWGATNLSPGTLYELSFYVAEVYWWDYDHSGAGIGSPASLGVYLEGVALNTFTLTQAPGNWMQYTVSFVPTVAQPNLSIENTNLAWRGNDFALDDITLHQPEPSAWMMGIGGIGAILLLRRRRRTS